MVFAKGCGITGGMEATLFQQNGRRACQFHYEYGREYPVAGKLTKLMDNKHIVVLSDGGYRNRQERAAAAWVVTELKAGAATIIAKGSTAIDACSSSFKAEAIALDNAVDSVKSKCFVGLNTIHGIQQIFSIHGYRADLYGKQWGLVA